MRYLIPALFMLLAGAPSPLRADAVDYDTQSITVALLQEPPNLDSTLSTDLVSFFVIGHVNEGLLRYDRRGQLAPGVAESWRVTADSMTFRLREDARWSDGSPVTARDFVFAWRRVNDPRVASPYAAIMYPIANAEKVQKGELPLTALGVEATGDRELLVRLESPCGYCLALMVHGAFYPINERFFRAQGEMYGAEAGNLLYNGPFELSEWVHGARLSMTKNPQYWNRDSIQLNRIDVGYITEDNRTRLNLFRDNRIALARLGAETVRDALEQGLRLRTFVSGGMAFLRFNMREGHVTARRDVRRAIRLVFDPDEFVNKVIAIPGYRAAYTFFPSWVAGVDGKFIDEYPVGPPEQDEAKARSLVAQARRDIGVEAMPTLTLLTVTSPTGAKIAEYFQGLLKQRLGIDVRVDQQVFKQYLDKSRNGQFDILVSSWYPDFDDIVTYADLMASWNPNNRGAYVNPAYDRQVQLLMKSADPRVRMDAAAALQDIILDDVPVLPMADTGSAYLQHEKLKGVVRRALGADPDYTFARVVK